MADSIKFSYNNAEVELPLVCGSEGETAIDIGNLRATTGLITIDPGYVNTGSTESSITFLNGEKGILRYRGYSIEELAAKSNFLEVAYLLIYGELPSQKEYEEFKQTISIHTMIHEDLRRMYNNFPKNPHPMAVMSSMICTMSAFYTDSSNPMDPRDREISMIRLLAKAPTIAAISYKKSVGQPDIFPRNDLDYAANFLRMMFAVPAEDYHVDPVVARAIDLLLILHADHEQNCSTSTARLVGSSRANLYASISSAVCALWGPLHGGANQAVIEMLLKIHESGGDTKKYVEMAKNHDSGFRLMGFGHRVYKNFDPRATIIKKTADDVLGKLGINDPLLNIAKELEEAALNDDYFVEKKLYPNVDFYSGIIYRALGIPTDMFTVMFTLGRLPGWIAQWKEMIEDPHARIGRPRQVYTGPNERPFVEIDKR